MRVSSVSMVGNYSSNHNLKTQNKKVLSQSVDAPVEKSEASFKRAGKALGTILRAALLPLYAPSIVLSNVIDKAAGISDGDFSENFANDVKDIILGNEDDDDD